MIKTISIYTFIVFLYQRLYLTLIEDKFFHKLFFKHKNSPSFIYLVLVYSLL